MIAYKNVLRILFSILILQIIFAIYIGPQLYMTDFFPFHQWALFAKVNRIETKPVIYVLRRDNQTYDPPEPYYNLIPDKGAVDFLVTHDNLNTWQNLLRKDKIPEAQEMLKSIERQVWAKNQTVDYEIWIIKFDVLEYAQKKIFKGVEKKFGPFNYTKESAAN